jgi:hypothetical protein
MALYPITRTPRRRRGGLLGLVFAALALACTAASAVVAAEGEACDPAGPTGYARLDCDAIGTQIWFGATHRLVGLTLASDVLLNGTTAEIDLGPSFDVADGLTLCPMGGLTLDYTQQRVQYLIPQFYLYATAGKWYLESWEFASFALRSADEPHTFTDRTFLLYSLGQGYAAGPHVETTVNLQDVGERVASLQVGGAFSTEYGSNNSLLLFAGYETRKQARTGDGLVGRVTFVREW